MENEKQKCKKQVMLELSIQNGIKYGFFKLAKDKTQLEAVIEFKFTVTSSIHEERRLTEGGITYDFLGLPSRVQNKL